MITKNMNAALVAVAMLVLAACGGSDEEASSDDGAGLFGAEEGGKLSDLPADFPRELIPPSYDTMNYTNLMKINGTRSAVFEEAANVQDAIDHYVDLIGEPTINVESGEGQRMVQWHTSPYPSWAVGVLGSDSETFVSVGTLPEQ